MKRPFWAAVGVALALLAAMGPAFAELATAPTFGAPRTLPSSAGFGEPGIAVAPDGAVYVTAPGSASALWRSDDSGASWRRVSDSLGSSGDSDVAIDANGVVYVSDLFSNVPVSTSFDRGASFAYEAATAASGSIDRQWLAAAGDGHVFSVWRDGSTERIAASHDRGVSWTRHVVATGVNLQGNILALDESTLLIPYSGSGGMRLARSTDAGVTWTSKVVHPDASTTLFPAVAADRAGNVYMAWTAKDNDAGYLVRLAVSRDGGQTFTTQRILQEGRTSIFPWIVAGDEGRVAMAWFDTAGIDPSLPVPPDAAALAPWTVRLAFSADAQLGHAASWSIQDATGVFHTGPICTMGTMCFPVANPVFGNRALLDFFEMAELQDGRIAIAYAADQASLPANSQTVLKVVVQDGGTDLKA